jgi:hypothetical protein
MKRLAFVLFLAAGGGSSPQPATPATSGSAPATAAAEPAATDAVSVKVVGPPEVAWKDMTHEQRGKFMHDVVMPKFKPMFVKFDPKGFDDFSCATCHGEGAKDHTFKMPNANIFVLPEAEADFMKLAKAKPDWMKFMPEVEHEMAVTLGMKPYDPAAPDPSQFGCYGCHTHKPGGTAE